MGQFPKKHKPLQHTHHERDNLMSPVTIKEIEPVILNS